MKILTIGAALTDILIDVPSDAFLRELGFPKGGMIYVDKDRQKSIIADLNKLDATIETGGSAANCAGVAAWYGGDAGFMGCVGDDELGREFERKLTKRGVDARLWISQSEGSGSVAAMVSKDGERTFGTYLGASATVSSDMLKKEDFEGVEYLFVEGYLIYNPNYIERAMELAKECGVKVAFDMASFNVVEENREYIEKLLTKYVDIIFANQQEVVAFGNLLECGCEIVVFKLGAEGAEVHCKGEVVRVAADKNVIVRDKTGAGDAFAGGFLYGLSMGFDIQKSAQYGADAADKIVQVMGAHLA